MFRTALLPSTATPAWKADITVLVNEHDSGKPDSHTRLLFSPCPSLSNFAIKLLTFAPLLCFHLYVACVQMYVCGHTCVWEHVCTCVHIHGGVMLILENPPLSLFDLFHWHRVFQSNSEPTVWLIFLTSLLGIHCICLPRLELHTGHCIRPPVLKPV